MAMNSAGHGRRNRETYEKGEPETHSLEGGGVLGEKTWQFKNMGGDQEERKNGIWWEGQGETSKNFGTCSVRPGTEATFQHR